MKLFDRPSRNWAYVSIVSGLLALGVLYVFLVLTLPLLLICLVSGVIALRIKPSSKLGWAGLALIVVWVVYLSMWFSAFNNAIHNSSSGSNTEAPLTSHTLNLN